MREIVHNVYRQFPFYYFTEEKAQETWMEMDGETLAEIEKRNGAYLEEVAENERNLREENAKKSKEANLEKNSSVSEESKKINNTDKIENKDNSEMSEIIENSENHLNSETQPANTLPQSNIVLPHPILDLSRDKLSDYDYLMNNFYIVDENTDASAVKINAAEFLAEDFFLESWTVGAADSYLSQSLPGNVFRFQGRRRGRYDCGCWKLSDQFAVRKIWLSGDPYKRSF